jgi:hypothetical protein
MKLKVLALALVCVLPSFAGAVVARAQTVEDGQRALATPPGISDPDLKGHTLGEVGVPCKHRILRGLCNTENNIALRYDAANKLVSIEAVIKNTQVSDLADSLKEKYGKPFLTGADGILWVNSQYAVIARERDYNDAGGGEEDTIVTLETADQFKADAIALQEQQRGKLE